MHDVDQIYIPCIAHELFRILYTIYPIAKDNHTQNATLSSYGITYSASILPIPDVGQLDVSRKSQLRIPIVRVPWTSQLPQAGYINMYGLHE
jgi:hypothetical protein